MSPDGSSSPTVSVIVRTRNRPALLAEALRDIEAQDYTDAEVIVVNDGDDAAAAVTAAAESVPGLSARLRIIDRTAERHGRALAANVGLRAARGEFLVLHDDDDTWAPDFLSVAVAQLRARPDAGAVSAHTEVVTHRTDPATGEERIERLLLNPTLSAITIEDMLRENRITTHSLLYRAQVHDTIGYLDESLVAHEDWDFYLRLIAHRPIELLPLPARAYWHHRPEATGDEGNSVFVLDADHDAARERIRDRHLRASVQRDGLGPALHLAAEVHTLELALREQHDELRAQNEQFAAYRAETSAHLEHLEHLEAQTAALSENLARMEAMVTALPRLVIKRTSISARLRRAGRRLTRRR